jgi:hypothetical protein
MIRLEWIEHVAKHPIKESIQKDGRIRRWAAIKEMDGKYLRIINYLKIAKRCITRFSTGNSRHENPIF